MKQKDKLNDSRKTPPPWKPGEGSRFRRLDVPYGGVAIPGEDVWRPQGLAPSRMFPPRKSHEDL